MSNERTPTRMGNLLVNYPEEREDWLMIKEYARKKSIYGCILCDKTHFRKDCEHKAKRTAKTIYDNDKDSFYFTGYGD